MPIEQGYLGEAPIIREEDKNYRHMHRCPKNSCGEWMCEDNLCKKYAGMRIWCPKHSHIHADRTDRMRYW
jgi:hypothetical protein